MPLITPYYPFDKAHICKHTHTHKIVNYYYSRTAKRVLYLIVPYINLISYRPSRQFSYTSMTKFTNHM